MRSFASPSFFRAFDLLLSTSNPGLALTHWRVNSVDWERQRLSFAGANYSVVLEVFVLRHPGPNGWTLMVTREFWWAGAKKDGLKTIRWARPLSGQAARALAWFRQQQHEREAVLTGSVRSR